MVSANQARLTASRWYESTQPRVCSDSILMNIKYRPRVSVLPKGGTEAEQVESFVNLFFNIYISIQVALDQGQIDESLFETFCKDVAAALMRWPAAAPRFDILLDRYPETKEYQIFTAVIHRGRHLI